MTEAMTTALLQEARIAAPPRRLAPLRIAYCGPIAQPGRAARGGYESANRRLIDDLRNGGIGILEFPYPVAEGPKLVKALVYAARFGAIAAGLLRARNRFDILHITPLYRQFIYAEAVLCLTAWSLGKRVMFDIRAGSFVNHYGRRSRLYRALVDRLMRRTDLLAVEGKEHMAFAAERHGGHIAYLPNYVKSCPAGPAFRPDPSRRLRLVFLSRIVPEKGIETALEVLEKLRAMGIDAELDAIGGGEQDYVDTLIERSRGLPVIWHGALPPDDVRELIAGANFFIFPSRHPGEGHSNALTEAMADGLVPVCSDNGFNASVVDEAGRVLPVSATADDYVTAILAIGTGSEWSKLSAKARRRVAALYTSGVVVPALIKAYRTAV